MKNVPTILLTIGILISLIYKGVFGDVGMANHYLLVGLIAYFIFGKKK